MNKNSIMHNFAGKCHSLVVATLLAGIILLFLTIPVSAATLTVTNTNDSGAGSLARAIMNSASGDTIDFSLTYPAIITLTSSELTIDKNLTITGPGADQLIISGNNSSRVFRIAGFEVLISGLTIAGGRANSGGGIYNDDDSTLTLTNCTISGNTATGVGGGIYNNYLSTSTLTNCTISGNTSADDGGGIYNADDSSSTLTGCTITQCTISGNEAIGGNGGGIYNEDYLELRHVTIADNTASGSGGGIYSNYSGFDVMEHTILGDNTANTGPDCDTNHTIASEQYNLIGDTTGYGGTFNPVTDILNQDPLLDSLTNNGGPTQTHALQDGSPAIDAGDPSFSGFQYDQRTSPFLRVIDGTIDIGAYESGEVPPIPTLNEWGMIMLALLISGSAFWSLRRKKIEL